MVQFITANREGLTILPKLESDPTISTKGEKQKKNPARFIGSDISDTTYQQIAAILLEQQQFDLAGYKDLCIKRRIATQIRAIRCEDPTSYVELLAADKDEQTKLLAVLSIHVSQFFRNPTMFNVLETKILPELLQASRQTGAKVSVWSIGCANGEEPYSIALLGQKLQRQNRFSIMATDLSPNAVVRAEAGLYSAARLTGVPDELLQQFFSAQGNSYLLEQKVRKQVQFSRHDILIDPAFEPVDLILCRNLLIYFSREQQLQILKKLASALHPGGYLVLGRAETLAPSCRKLFVCIDPAERIYQRLEDTVDIKPAGLGEI